MGSQIRLANLEGGAAGQKLLPKSPQPSGIFFLGTESRNATVARKGDRKSPCRAQKIGIVFVLSFDVFGFFGTKN